jgi:radical SAM superfamily enzyme YgiQ (UPF0313 family)
MRTKDIYYCEPVFRPPSEANSLLIQATEGCTFRCSFCVSNIGKNFKVRSFEEIKQDLDNAKEIYGEKIQRIFFLDGNAMIMQFTQLLTIIQYAKSVFPFLERTSVYAHAKDILGKTEAQLKELSEAGLKMAYIGIETGDDTLLKKIGKRVTSDEIVQAFHKLFKAGITPSGTIILGLAGNDPVASKKHMIKSAELVNKASPVHVFGKGNAPEWYISCLALMLPKGTPIYQEMIDGSFNPLNADEIMREMQIFMETINDDVENCIFRSNHASNYLAIKGVLAQDKAKILALIKRNLKEHTNVRPEFFRAL